MVDVKRFVTALIMAVLTATACAQAGLDRPIRLIVPYAVGSHVDIVARLIAPGLRQELGQSVIVDNRPGSGGLPAGQMVAQAAPDGATLLVSGNGPVLHSPLVFERAAYRWDRDFSVVGSVSFAPLVLLASRSLWARDLRELIEHAKAAPGELTMATPGAGSTHHLTSELLKSVTGAGWTTVHYRRASQAITALLGERVQLSFDQVLSAAPLVRQGRLRALAVTASQRSSALPEVPTFAEAGLTGFEIATFVGMFAPVATPTDTVFRLNSALVRVLHDPQTVGRLAAVGADAHPMHPDAFLEWLKREDERWVALIQKANVRAE